MKPLNVGHIKGELIENDEWNKKKILYKNAFGDNIDLEVVAKNIGFDKLVVINEKPKDLSEDLEFSFEIDLDDYIVRYRDGQEWDKQGSIESDQPFILEKLKQTWFREFSVWDSAGNRGKIRVRLEAKGAKPPIGGLAPNSANKYIFTKIINKEFLENAVYPVYTDDTVSYYAGAGDGDVGSSYGSWSTVQNEATGANTDYTGYYPYIAAYHEIGGNYTISRSFFPIDTSGIDDDANITGAILKLYKKSVYDGDNDGDDFMVVVQTNQALTSELSTADYDQCGNTVDNPTEGSNRIDLGSIVYGYNSFTLNDAGITWIDKTGWTKLGLREGHDVLDHAVIAVNDTENGIVVYSSEYTATYRDPYLEVTTIKSNVPYALSTVDGGQFLIMNSGTTYTATSTTNINDSEWHHIVGSYDGTTMKIYIDGTLEDTNTDFSGNLPTNDGNVRIGADYQSTPDNFFNGLIDEARIYNRALSADEIGELYRVGDRKMRVN